MLQLSLTLLLLWPGWARFAPTHYSFPLPISSILQHTDAARVLSLSKRQGWGAGGRFCAPATVFVKSDGIRFTSYPTRSNFTFES